MVFHKMVRVASLGLLLLLLGAMVYYFALAPKYRIEAGSISFQDRDADLGMDNLHVVQNEQGAREWELRADSARVYREKDLTVLENLRLLFYPKEGAPLEVTARHGTMQNESRNMEVRGDVVILASNGVSMKTDSLRFHPKEKRVASQSRVLITGERFRLVGTGLRGRTDLGSYELQEKVSATIYAKTPRPKNEANGGSR